MMTPSELIQRACPKIGDLGAAFFFHPDTLARGKELGLDGFRFYFVGRGGVLGDVEAAVITSAFGYFAPELLAKFWDSGKKRLPPRETAREYLACAQDFGRSTFGAIDGLDAFCQAAEAINNAADGTSLALYAGHRAEPLCDDVPGRAIQLTMLLREYRGSAHLAALRSLGLNVAVAHAIKRPDDVTMFGYTEAPAISDEDRAKHKVAETLTDDMVRGAFSAVDTEGAEALIAGLDAMEAAIDG